MRIKNLVTLAILGALIVLLGIGSLKANPIMAGFSGPGQGMVSADLAAVSKGIVDLPEKIAVGERAELTVVEEVANFGPSGPIPTEVFEVMFTSEDCASSFHVTSDFLADVDFLEVAAGGEVLAMNPAAGEMFEAVPGVPLGIRFHVTLDDDEVLSLTEMWSILCTETGEQAFDFVKVVLPVDDTTVFDSDPENNEIEEFFSITVQNEPRIVNDQLQPVNVKFPAPGEIRPGAFFTIVATFLNTGPELTDLFFEVVTLEYLSGSLPGPSIANRDAGTPAGVGAEITVIPPGTLDTGETVELRIDVDLGVTIQPFELFVNALTTTP